MCVCSIGKEINSVGVLHGHFVPNSEICGQGCHMGVCGRTNVFIICRLQIFDNKKDPLFQMEICS